jgi:hypothetical protein
MVAEERQFRHVGVRQSIQGGRDPSDGVGEVFNYLRHVSAARQYQSTPARYREAATRGEGGGASALQLVKGRLWISINWENAWRVIVEVADAAAENILSNKLEARQ